MLNKVLYVHNFIYSHNSYEGRLWHCPILQMRTQTSWVLSLSHTVEWQGKEHTRPSFSRAHVFTDSLVPMTHFFFCLKNLSYRMVPLKPVACGQPNLLNHSSPEGCSAFWSLNVTAVPQCLPGWGCQQTACGIDCGCPDGCTLYLWGRMQEPYRFIWGLQVYHFNLNCSP